jgi:long-subunit fatty acid transport protein
LSFVLNKRAIISIEHEYLDYSSAQLNAEYYAFLDENETIDIAYSSTSNVRIGSELRVHPQLSVRGGYAYYGSPFTNTNNDSSTEFLTFGFGLQVNQYFFDFALISSYNNSNLSLYSGSEEARLSNQNEQIVISGGFKF